MWECLAGNAAGTLAAERCAEGKNVRRNAAETIKFLKPGLLILNVGPDKILVRLC
jgi:hypothetical protein